MCNNKFKCQVSLSKQERGQLTCSYIEAPTNPPAQKPSQPPAPAHDPPAAAKKDNTLQSLPIRAYLDQTVVPVLLQALSEAAKER